MLKYSCKIKDGVDIKKKTGPSAVSIGIATSLCVFIFGGRGIMDYKSHYLRNSIQFHKDYRQAGKDTG